MCTVLHGSSSKCCYIHTHDHLYLCHTDYIAAQNSMEPSGRSRVHHCMTNSDQPTMKVKLDTLYH